MLLRPGGLDVFYIDESHDSKLYAVTAIAVPFLRNNNDLWTIVWPDHLEAPKAWRKRISTELKIPTRKELHGTKLISGRGNFLYGTRQFQRPDAVAAYKQMLSSIGFVPEASVITVVGQRGPQMFGHARLQRVMYALFQRMRKQCVKRRVNAMTFFDEGHPEYRRLYRRARVNLPTGSMFGGWGIAYQRDMPLDMFVKDANEKCSADCIFTQTADLIAFAALCKRRAELGMLTDEQHELGLGTLYDPLPELIRNTRASLTAPRDAIVRLT
jgi:hypothetical protein